MLQNVVHEGFQFCPHCELVLPADTDHFYRNKMTKSGLTSWCRDCTLERASVRTYMRGSTPPVPRKPSRRHFKKIVEDVLASTPCQACGEAARKVLQFHHRVPAEKSFLVSAAMTKCPSEEALHAEIAKCDVLCANCHRRVTYPKSPTYHTRIKRWFYAYKSTLRCEVCGDGGFGVLDFHHKDPTRKVDSISMMLTYPRRGYGNMEGKIMREIAKCRVLCANCHIKEHDALHQKRKEARAA